ncbi:MAG: hypothetical protein J7J82_07695 [Staphylothermus sp.]|nr:hypothetical protein [Staphylothermus sp.]
MNSNGKNVEVRGFMCKKDGKPMYFVEETEKMSNGQRRSVFYYRCPICGYRIEVEQVVINVSNDSIVVKRRIRKK